MLLYCGAGDVDPKSNQKADAESDDNCEQHFFFHGLVLVFSVWVITKRDECGRTIASEATIVKKRGA